MKTIDVANPNYYNSNYDAQRTKLRLVQIKGLGLYSLGNGQFGIKPILSGIYIERLWKENNEEWLLTLKWLNDVIEHAKTTPLQLTYGAEAIARERRRQIDKELFAPTYDLNYKNNELIWAAIAYALPEGKLFINDTVYYNNQIWPWNQGWLKFNETDHEKNLIKAGALIAAALDKIQLQRELEHSTTDEK